MEKYFEKMESLKSKVIDGLEYAKTTLEKKDEELINRPAYFAQKKDASAQNGHAQDVDASKIVAVSSDSMNGIKLIEAKEQNFEKFQ